MENFSKISEILKNPKQDKISFLSSLLDLTLCPLKIEEYQESTYQKSILYITCWVVLPRTSLTSLPSDFQSISSLLDTDTSSLFPKFQALFIKHYPSLPELICNDTLLALLLTIPASNDDFLRLLSPHHCIGPLLWLLTYAPEHLRLASEFLPRAIMKAGGVHELMDCFSKGDDTWKLKNLFIKMLKTTPKNNKNEYIESVVRQVVQIMTQFKCDKITENIMEEVSNFFLLKFPNIVLPWIQKEKIAELNASQIVKFFRVFAQYLPPHRAVLFGISEHFQVLIEFWRFLKDSVLQVKNELFTVFVQFFVFWEPAGFEFCSFIEKKSLGFSFAENNQGEVEVKKEKSEKMLEEGDLNSFCLLLSGFCDVSGASVIMSKIFFALIQRFAETRDGFLMFCLSFVLSSTEPILLVQMPRNTEHLVKTCIDLNDDSLLKVSLQLLLNLPQDYLSKDFLISISAKVIQLQNHPEMAQLALDLNQKISKILKGVQKAPENTESQWMDDLQSQEDYLNAIGLRHLCMVLDENTKVPWKTLHAMLEKQVFVYGEALKVYIRALDVFQQAGLEEIFSFFHASQEPVQLRLMEVLFFYCKRGKKFWQVRTLLLDFINQLILNETSENLSNSALVVAAQAVRRLKASFFPFMPQCVYWILAEIKLANSRILTQAAVPKNLNASLLLLRKILKHCKDSFLPVFSTTGSQVLGSL